MDLDFSVVKMYHNLFKLHSILDYFSLLFASINNINVSSFSHLTVIVYK